MGDVIQLSNYQPSHGAPIKRDWYFNNDRADPQYVYLPEPFCEAYRAVRRELADLLPSDCNMPYVAPENDPA